MSKQALAQSQAQTGNEPTPDAQPRTSTTEFPPVKVTVKSLSGDPIQGVSVALRKTGVQASDTSAKGGVAIDRTLPFGTYTLSAKTLDGWATHQHQVVEFDKGLDLTIVAPNPGEKSQVVLESQFKPAGLDTLPLGKWQEREGAGTFVRFTPEPGEPRGNLKAFPTHGHGIDEIALTLWLTLKQSIPQPAGPEIEWTWLRDKHTPLAGKLLLTAESIRAITKTSLTSKVPLPDATYFTPQLRNRFEVGGERFTLGEVASARAPYKLSLPPGELTVYIGNVYGRPNEEVRAALGLEKTSSRNAEDLWLPASLEANSQWILRLMNLDGWQRRPESGLPHLTSWQQSLKPNEEATVKLAPGHNRNEPVQTD